jgi:hypothetical protein
VEVGSNYKATSSGTAAPNPHDYPWSESNMRFGANHPTSNIGFKGSYPKKENVSR